MSTTSSPSYEVKWCNTYFPEFPLDVNTLDHDQVRQHCNELAHLRRQASFNPVHPGLAFEAVIEARNEFPSSDYRPLPSFALKEGRFQVVVRTGIQNEPVHWSQVWVADVKEMGHSESLGPVILKLFQASLMPPPQLLNHDSIGYTSPRQLASIEDLVYNALGDLQGSVISYYYGKHKFLMPNCESTHAIILEYIEGKTLADIHDVYSPHHPLEVEKGPLPQKIYCDYLKTIKGVYAPILKGMKDINARQVILIDIIPENIIITSTMLKRAVFMDFGQAMLRAPPNVVAEYANDFFIVRLLTNCCPKHKEDVEKWAKETLPADLHHPAFVLIV
ncbi:uncharacterized protein BT62DRAFT_919064 [Guyanagaster necrorhizus]|uniref:Protein kinase domain-containing protein n=1 Tax=Guyanagaster necrorhizus TaxID=856835 RepID=A0A9P7VX92_9AGAR|nr:uncharacterized protein BT62DRAFT_919064 [Guyanagaster necrorhizus MCA 3950]KAG7447884.1 hypothetical protein BT62DRAFT_919064 [Guyanagaster necrorhizus MCA 3950]